MSTTWDDRPRRARREHRALRWIGLSLLVLLVAAGLWCWWVAAQILYFARTDQAAPSDAIAVFGAAEYAGKPSPVYRARLDHAKNLYAHGIASLIITLGGPGGDRFTEGGVGQAYLMGTGIPESDLIAETHSRNTTESAARLAVIARANHLQRIVVVSDPMHLFRIHAICAADGLNVVTSPRPPSEKTEEHLPPSDPIWHEIVTYTLWRVKLD
ncbi:YdcF family protein [Occallatibacter riparius]|uniref:YdcF family protein n=1 Tax=Occallatibacter riparius TaxID=1002689 RepID=A0A9J7BPX7_9BACT|nr:YdcF family protein [Occallatibacter riparius]UWZ83165.1 YdcF family protein [Occallatibacter riparius]